jgi:hypothetical protein
MIGRFGSVILLCAGTVVLDSWPAISQEHPPCPPAPKLEASTTSVATKTALDAVSKLVGRIGIHIDVRTTRDSVLKDNPRADQAVIVLTMANTLCEMIWSDSTLSGAEKAARFQNMMRDMLSRALGPAPVARTDRHTQGRRDGQGGLIVLASADPSALLLVAENEPGFTLPEPQTGFLRDPPFYVNDSNKYFVIVGSARTREEGLRLMNRLKSKAPQYDFALYEPYGDNPYYGVMMASWVPHHVAMEALRLARRDVAHDAYLWACRSSGQSC